MHIAEGLWNCLLKKWGKIHDLTRFQLISKYHTNIIQEVIFWVWTRVLGTTEWSRVLNDNLNRENCLLILSFQLFQINLKKIPTQFVNMWKICTISSRDKLKVQTGCHRLLISKRGVSGRSTVPNDFLDSFQPDRAALEIYWRYILLCP